MVSRLVGVGCAGARTWEGRHARAAAFHASRRQRLCKNVLSMYNGLRGLIPELILRGEVQSGEIRLLLLR